MDAFHATSSSSAKGGGNIHCLRLGSALRASDLDLESENPRFDLRWLHPAMIAFHGCVLIGIALDVPSR